MASYYPSFTYMGLNSLKDKHLRVVAFDADSGEHDTFLGMDPIYTDKYDGTRRIDYGAKFNSVAVIKISVVKLNKTDFTVAEVRDFLKWTTGIRQTSYLDLVSGDTVKFSFLGRVTNAYQQKMDARTVGLTIEFTSISPWAYSPIQSEGYDSNQGLILDSEGILQKTDTMSQLQIDTSGVLYNNMILDLSDKGTVYINTSRIFQINNKTDDLYTPIYLNTTVTSNIKSDVSIKNVTLDEETVIQNVAANEVITLSDKQFILSDKSERVFGNDFNFKWPRLAPGVNDFIITMDGDGSVIFTYRYPIKIGDCAIDINDLLNECEDSSDDTFGDFGFGTEIIPPEGEIIQGDVSWAMIKNTPTTLEGYGITNAYTTTQVDEKIADIDIDDNINENELNNMLNGLLKS